MRSPLAIHGDFRALPTQARFLSSSTRHKAYIGPMGSGKSEALCRHAIACCVGIPGNQWVLGRFTKRDFERTTRITMDRVLLEDVVERELAGGDGWILKTRNADQPSTIWTAHYDETGPYASMDLGGFGIDEVNGDDLSPSVPEPVFRMLSSRLGRLRHIAHPYGLLVGNPGGHNWVWRLFSPHSPDHRSDCELFKPRPFENAANLRDGYYQDLLRNGEDWAQRYVYGSDDVFEGQVYPELNDALHAIDPFPIPPEWPRIVSLDHGLRNPTCVGFAAVSWDGEIFLYDEHYEAGQTVGHHARAIQRHLAGMAKAQSVTWVADPSIFAKSLQQAGRVFSVYDEYADEGLAEWTPGENDVAAGRNRIKQLLGANKLKFFRGRVPNVWREMQGLRWRRLRLVTEQGPPEQEADIDNHCLHGDTRVTTPDGEIPLRELAARDGRCGWTLHPDGSWVRFRNARLTRHAVPTVVVSFEDGRQVRCTPNHRFLTMEGTWVEAIELTGLSVCNSIPNTINEALCESLFSAPQSKSLPVGAITSRGSISSASLGESTDNGCIVSFGSRLMDQFRRAMKFITPTETERTISRKILSSSLVGSIGRFTGVSAPSRAGRISIVPLLPPLSGTEVALAESGTGSTTGLSGRLSTDGRRNGASNAAGLSLVLATRASAPTCASRLGAALREWTTRSASARSVTRNSPSTVSLPHARALASAAERSGGKPARVASVSEAGSSDVYCLTVPGVDCFAVEGGILVANSPDMLRYLVMSRPDPAVRPPQPKPLPTHADRQRQFLRQHIKRAVAAHHGQFQRDDDSYV